jgi:hypothetical protein
LATAAILSLLLLASGGLLALTYNLAESSKATMAATATMDQLRAIMASSAKCTANLLNTALAAPAPALAGGAQPAALFDFDSLGNKASTVVALDPHSPANSVASGMAIADIRVLPIARLGGNLFVADLVVTFARSKARFGAEQLTRRVPLLAIAQAGLLTQCYSGTAGAFSIAQQDCAYTLGGMFNPVTGTCQPPTASQWFSGTMQAATCPSGWYLPRGATSTRNCNAALPGGFTDPFPPSSVTMMSGAVDQTQPPPAAGNLNAAGTGCACVYATDLPAASVAGSTCQVLCVQ